MSQRLLMQLLPESEKELRKLITESGGQYFAAGRVWWTDVDGLHYRTVDDLSGRQLELGMNIPFPKDTLFGR